MTVWTCAWRACVSLVCASVFAPSLVAQPGGPAPQPFWNTVRMRSTVLGEERVADVSLPRGYDGSNERYPVVIVLDGEINGEPAAASAHFYAATGMMPKTIVVAVHNTHRTRDLTPAPAREYRVPPEVAENGGAGQFLRFLSDELLPLIDKTYRTAPMRVLVGHSLGGLFALYALTQQPALFTGYAIMEPAIWWNAERDWRDALATLGTARAARARMMFVNTPFGGLDTSRWGGDAPMVRYRGVAGETHESMAAPGMLIAFRTMFEDFRPSEWKPGTKPIAMLDRYDSLSVRVGYDVPIPASAFDKVALMSIHAREFDDADRALTRRERSFGPSTDLRAMLAEERQKPPPAGLIPLVIPASRPSPAAAAAFLGQWARVGSDDGFEMTVRASGDTIIVHDRIQFPDGSWTEADDQVIQVTPEGTLEWGLPWFRGIAALLVLKGTILPDGTLRVAREPRGWVPVGPGGNQSRVDVFRRVSP
jgi:uncharacterized protein